VSLENSKFPVLGLVSKSFLQELHNKTEAINANPYKYFIQVIFCKNITFYEASYCDGEELSKGGSENFPQNFVFTASNSYLSFF